MGHTTAKDIYRRLGKKIDSLPARVPWNETLHEILKKLYTPQEADVLVRMPWGLASFAQIARVTEYEPTELHLILEKLSEKGLVFDIWIRDQYRYMAAPLAVGIFELTMMRTRGELRYAEWARLFHDYLEGGHFYAANFQHGERVSMLRALPHEEAIDRADSVEILDYEKATALIENAARFCIGLCSCRHEKLHVGEKRCNVPLATCSAFGPLSEVLIRHGMAEEVSRSAMLENLARSRELKLVLTADNVQKNASFICHCCGCCCNLLLGISRHGFPNAIVTSTYLPRIEEKGCSGCAQCVKACPIGALSLAPPEDTGEKKTGKPRVDERVCIGCGVCGLACNRKAVRLLKRKQHVLHPATNFERLILTCLERGTLQNYLFSDPQRVSQKFLRGFLGGFLRLPPVKQALMSDQLQSLFLAALQSAARRWGKSWLLEI